MMMIPLTNRTVEVTGLGFPAINTDVGPSAPPITPTALFLVNNEPAIIRTPPAKPVKPQIHFFIPLAPFVLNTIFIVLLNYTKSSELRLVINFS